MGFARLAESSLRQIRGKGDNEKLGALDKILASSIGGALATWNQPIEVVRVEVNHNFKQIFNAESKTKYDIDAIYVQKCSVISQSTCKADDF